MVYKEKVINLTGNVTTPSPEENLSL